MAEHTALFIAVLKAELEDCIEDLFLLSHLYEKRRQLDEIGDYVCNENEAFLSREIMAVRNMINLIDDLKIGEYDSLTSIAAAVEAIVQKEIAEYEDPLAAASLVERKLKKVADYVLHHDD